MYHRRIVPLRATAIALLVALTGSAYGPRIFAQSQPQPAPSIPPAFEVATIKPNNDVNSPLRIMMNPANFGATHASLKDLIRFAWHFKSDDQIDGAPGWIGTEFYDVQAKISDAEVEAFNKMPLDQRFEQRRMMLQALLADRFQLKASLQMRKRPVYALVVAKGGPKLKEVEVSPPPPPGTPRAPGGHYPQLHPTGHNQFTASAWPMSMMADWLSYFSELGNRIVIDDTGLKGNYDWVLNGVSQQPPQPQAADATTPDEPPTSIFTALQEQLGLKLEPRKALVEVLVIDHVGRPSPN
ncbi:MAG: TIGR03435 family protein [Terracidiphilus sp.]